VTIRQANSPIESDPTHQPAVREILPAPSGLPNALLGLVPVVGEPANDVADAPPALLSRLKSMLVSEVETVDRLAVDVELHLIGGTIPDPHRA
jgi:hypothetical protein